MVAYHKKQVSGSIGNPWHTDYRYTFSPNLSWSYFQHKTDKSLVDTDIPFAEDYEVNYLALSLGESCLLYTSPSPRDRTRSRMPSSA